MKLEIFCTVLLVATVASKPSPLSIDSKIVGGTDALQHEFPHQISFQRQIASGEFRHNCGASILNENWLLTAAHCISDATFSVVAGRHNISLPTEETEQRRAVDYFVIHPGYPGNFADHDVALIRMSEPLVLNEFVQAINLPEAGIISSGDAIVSGWGLMDSGSSLILPDILQKLTSPIIPHADCFALLSSLGSGSLLLPENLCTGPLTGGQGVCSADSGGPLIQDDTVIGIVSWGFVPCGTPNRPSVYATVADYIDWIESSMALKR